MTWKGLSATQMTVKFVAKLYARGWSLLAGAILICASVLVVGTGLFGDIPAWLQVAQFLMLGLAAAAAFAATVLFGIARRIQSAAFQ